MRSCADAVCTNAEKATKATKGRNIETTLNLIDRRLRVGAHWGINACRLARLQATPYKDGDANAIGVRSGNKWCEREPNGLATVDFPLAAFPMHRDCFIRRALLDAFLLLHGLRWWAAHKQEDQCQPQRPIMLRSVRRRPLTDLCWHSLLTMQARGMPLYLWEKLAADGQTGWDVGRRRAERNTGSFSYRNATIIEFIGAAAGALIGYEIQKEPEPVPSDMPAMFIPLQELENLAPDGT
jgi:hypothetical protein